MVMIDEREWLEERGLLKKKTRKEQVRDIPKDLPVAVAKMQIDNLLPKPQETYIYFIRCGDKVKIGKARNPSYRLRNMQVGNPEPLHIYGVAPSWDTVEKDLHRKLRQYRHSGEWFWWNEEVQKAADNLPRFYKYS